MLADGVGNLNWDSRYFGRKVYNPAIGKMCRTLLAVLNMRMSFFNKRFTVFGKSIKKLRQQDPLQKLTYCKPLMLGCFRSSLWTLGVGLAVERRFGNANIAKEASIKRPDMRTKPLNKRGLLNCRSPFR